MSHVRDEQHRTDDARTHRARHRSAPDRRVRRCPARHGCPSRHPAVPADARRPRASSPSSSGSAPSSGTRSCTRAPSSPPPRCPGGCSRSPSPRPRAASCTSSAAVEARSVSMSELPLVLGLFFASPLALLAGRLVGCAVTLLSPAPLPAAQDLLQPRPVRRRDGRVARGVLRRQLVGRRARHHGLGRRLRRASWRPTCSAAAPSAWSSRCTTAASRLRALVARRLSPARARRRWSSRWAWSRSRASPPPRPAPGCSIGFGALLLLAYRAYAALSDRHLNLERLYRFSQAVSSSPEIDQVMTTVLGEAKELLRSDRASAAFVGPDGGLIARVRLGASGRLARSEEPSTPEDDWVLQQVVQGGQPLLMPRTTRDPDARRWLASYGMREAVAVPAHRRERRRRRPRRRRPAGRRPDLREERRAPAGDRRQPGRRRAAQRRADRPAAPRGPARRPHRAAEPDEPAALPRRRAGRRPGRPHRPAPR